MTTTARVVAGISGIRPAGDRAILVEVPGLAQVLSLQAQLQERPRPGQLDVVAAACTVLITADSAQAARGLAAHVRTLDLAREPRADGALVVIETVYDGDDLDEVGQLTGLGRDGVVRAHSQQVWTAAFGGFAPGFAYLAGQDSRLEVPRRQTPRTGVPAGSVALGGVYSAVYPARTPGGWQLIGRTDARMWDLERVVPALVRPGDRVRFKAVRAQATAASLPAEASSRQATSRQSDAPPVGAAPGGQGAGLVVIRPGPQSTIQDLGRPGYADLGVTDSGALDCGALRQANRLAGNPEDAAALEVLQGGLVVAALTDQVLAVTGAPAVLSITVPAGAAANTGRAPSRHVPMGAPFALLAGEILELGRPFAGLRSYLAARGGFDAVPVMGSRSTDTMSGIGPLPLAPGTELAVAPARPGSIVGAPEIAPEILQQALPEAAASCTRLRIVPGPRDDWFSPEALAQFTTQDWVVTQQSNRIGLRMAGAPLQRARTGELASEGTVRGAVQVPPEGQPVLFLADHPVTGGYPVIGVVVTADLDRAAQLPPGHRVRFIPCCPDPTGGAPSRESGTGPIHQGSTHA
ncbi:MAG: 5-oxoprolinase/urea amidolyase family protein [Actinomycetota bacterium]|nr:5-oxoprolinase/urea amidolyase family protein [Actinomycetota bacterium]